MQHMLTAAAPPRDAAPGRSMPGRLESLSRKARFHMADSSQFSRRDCLSLSGRFRSSLRCSCSRAFQNSDIADGAVFYLRISHMQRFGQKSLFLTDPQLF
jgi:hypothetical protein